MLDLAQYFNGTVDGWGMFQDRSGKVVKRFYVRIDAKWDGNKGTLDEHFEYTDGEKQNRVWTLVKDGDRYTGTAADVVGTAAGMRRRATRCAGTTCWRCRWTGASGTWTWTTGCT